MRNPGPITQGTPEHKALIDYATHLSKSFDIALAPAVGQLLKFYSAMCEAADSEMKMSSLLIGIKPPEAEDAQKPN
jgi:hypothetical protein